MAGKLNAKAPKNNSAPPPAAEKTLKQEWLNVDESTAKAAGGAYGAWQKAQELADEKKYEFEEAFINEGRKRGSIPEGKTLQFSYRFGIGVALIDDDGKPRRKGGRNKSFQM